MMSCACPRGRFAELSMVPTATWLFPSCDELHRDLQVVDAVALGAREAAGPDVDLNRWQEQQRRLELGIACLLLTDGRLPGITVAAGRLVVVAHEKPRLVGQREQAPNGAVELARAASREIGTRRAVVRHE